MLQGQISVPKWLAFFIKVLIQTIKAISGGYFSKLLAILHTAREEGLDTSEFLALHFGKYRRFFVHLGNGLFSDKKANHCKTFPKIAKIPKFSGDFIYLARIKLKVARIVRFLLSISMLQDLQVFEKYEQKSGLFSHYYNSLQIYFFPFQ